MIVPRFPAALVSVADVLAKSWRATVQRYGNNVELALRGLRFERAGGVWRCAVTRRRFAQFVRRPSPEKQAVVTAFQTNFNAVRVNGEGGGDAS